MQPYTIHQISLNGSAERPMLADVFLPEKDSARPTLLFFHGFKGFKDWGAWHAMALHFAKQGYPVVLANFSHNGTTVTKPTEFADLPAFGQNTYGKELYDAKTYVEWILNESIVPSAHGLVLMGHSRGGGIACLTADAFKDEVGALILLASVESLDRFGSPNEIETWKENGVRYVLNGRTGQNMPLNYSLYEDYKSNEKAYDIQAAVKRFNKPVLALHGTEDGAVDYTSVKAWIEQQPKAHFVQMQEVNHVFGASHPWEKEHLPSDLAKACQHISLFLERIG